MGGAKPQGTILAIHQVEHDSFPIGVASPTATALPELCRLELGQEGFQRAGGIHLLSNNR